MNDLFPQKHKLFLSQDYNYISLLVLYCSNGNFDMVTGEGYLKIYDSQLEANETVDNSLVYSIVYRYNLSRAINVDPVFGTEEFGFNSIYNALAENINGYYWSNINMKKLNYTLDYKRLFPISISESKSNNSNQLFSSYLNHQDFFNEIYRNTNSDIKPLIKAFRRLYNNSVYSTLSAQ